jgi:hypothetical protein
MLFMFTQPVCAMMPAAMVVEIVTGNTELPLASCPELRIHRGEFQISKGIARWLEQRDSERANWHARSDFRRLEDLSLAMFLRTPDNCEVMLSDRNGEWLPSSWRVRLPFRTWRIVGDTIRLRGRTTTELEPSDYKVLPERKKPSLRLYHHGRLGIFLGLHARKVRAVGVDDTVSVHLEGPGDEARFLFHARRAGSLILERTPGNMPNLDMLIGKDEQDLRPRGMMHVAAGERALVTFGYRGAEPIDLDVGFLFTPDSARVNLGARYGTLHCEPMRSPQSERKGIKY